MNPAKTRYALLVAADALDRDADALTELITEDGNKAELTASQVIDALRIYASLLGQPRQPAPLPSPEEQAVIDRFGIFAEEAGQ